MNHLDYRKPRAPDMAIPDPKPSEFPDPSTLAASGRRVFKTEAGALEAVGARLDGAFSEACRRILACSGRVVCTGMGKSGHVARKIAATLASTGTPAFYMHPGEAGHGDLGMVTDADLVLAVSYSGESDEILMLLPVLKRQGNVLLAMTGRPGSTLARAADVHLDISVPEEACPLHLAPTSSTTASMAMGDALAVALLEARGFTPDQFRTFHPGGKLGASLVKASEIMHRGDALPLVTVGAAMQDAIREISSKGFGCVAVVDAEGRLEGIVTDGDLRRHVGPDILTKKVEDIMTGNPKRITPDTLAGTALQIVNASSITSVIVVEDERPVGLVHLHDLLRIGAA